MTARIPIIPTIIVGLAILVMVRLGFWQLNEMQAEERRVEAWQSIEPGSRASYPFDLEGRASALYRLSSLSCSQVTDIAPRAGYSSAEATGWTYIANCLTVDGEKAEVALGWSTRPNENVKWSGGTVEGVIGRGVGDSVRLYADPPLAGLGANKRPQPDSEKVEMHLSYAGQWFFFALTALVIYIIALRRRRNAP